MACNARIRFATMVLPIKQRRDVRTMFFWIVVFALAGIAPSLFVAHVAVDDQFRSERPDIPRWKVLLFAYGAYALLVSGLWMSTSVVPIS